VWNDEEGKNVSLRLLPDYMPWAEVFSCIKNE
jgi:hypothetical protein